MNNGAEIRTQAVLLQKGLLCAAEHCGLLGEGWTGTSLQWQRGVGRDPLLVLTALRYSALLQAHNFNSSQASFSSHTQRLLEQHPREEETQTIPFTPALMLGTPPYPASFSLAIKTLLSTNVPLTCKSLTCLFFLSLV